MKKVIKSVVAYLLIFLLIFSYSFQVFPGYSTPIAVASEEILPDGGTIPDPEIISGGGSISGEGSMPDPETIPDQKLTGMPEADTEKPVITLLGPSEVTIQLDSPYADEGATANDNLDEDITSTIVVTNTVEITQPGDYTVSYNVTDSSGNAADEVTRIVHVVGASLAYQSAAISSSNRRVILTFNEAIVESVDDLKQAITFAANGTEFAALGAGDSVAIDGVTLIVTFEAALSGDTNAIKIPAGSLKDIDGRIFDMEIVTEPIAVMEVEDTAKPVITLNGTSEITVQVGSTYTDAGSTAYDNADGNISSEIVVTNPVDTSTLGTYTIRYNVTDSDGQAAEEVTRTVHVVPNSPSNLTISSFTGFTASLAWTAPANTSGITGYEIDRDGVKIGTSTSTNYTDTGLEPDETYSYTVRSFDAAGNISAPSNSSTVTTSQDDYGDSIASATAIPVLIETPGDINYPGDEDYLRFTAPLEGSYLIKSTGAFDTYGYLYDDLGTLINENDDVTDEDSNFAMTQTLSADKTYYLRVKSNQTNFTGHYGLIVMAPDHTPPTIPQDLAVVSYTAKSATLQWSAATDDIALAGYAVYRDGSQIGKTANLMYTDSSLAINSTYTYTVRAYDGAGNSSADSNSVTVTTTGMVIKEYPLAAGANHSIKLKDGKVWTWGYNNYGQLGDGTTTNRTTAVQVPGLSGFKAVAGGLYHTLALKDDGTIRAWGYGGNGQLGDGTSNTNYSPVQVQGLTAVSTIAAGDYHSVALSDGLVWTWGYNGNGQLGDGTYSNRFSPVQVPGLAGVIAIAAGANYTMALKEDGTVWAWGYGKGWNNQLTPYQVDGLSGITEISARGNHNVALKNDGTVWTWESWDSSAVQVEGISGASAVAAGSNFSMALKNDGTVWTWGSNNHGQLGDETTTDRSTPAQVAGLTDVVAIAGGNYHSLAKRGNGTLWAWGNNAEGEIGDGTITQRTAPVISADTQAPSHTTLKGTLSETAITLTWTACTDNVGVAGYNIYMDGTKIDSTTATTYTANIIIGENHSYVVKAVDAAGNESTASNPVGSELSAPSIPTNLTVVAKTVKSVSLTWTASTDDVGVTGYEIHRDGIKVGITTGTSYTDSSLAPNTTYSYTVKAYDASGNISNPSTAVEFTTDKFVLISGSLAAGSNHSITLKEGKVWTWGYNVYGQLGDGAATNQTTAVQVQGLSGFKAVAAGGLHTLALKDDGTLWDWGYGGNGQLGDGTWNTHYTPVQVEGLTAVSTIAAGDSHSVALSDGLVWTWGANGNGQLGDGTNNYQLSPVQVQAITGITAIAAGTNYTIALKEDGTVWSWGYGKGWNSYYKPYQVDGLSGITEISARGNHNLALKDDGTVWTWESWDSSAVQVEGISGATAVAAGSNFSIALRNDGAVWTWGSNNYGQLGDGTTTDRSTPSQVAGLTDIVAIAGGYHHSLAKQDNGTLWAWGYNTEGEIGDGSITHRATPVVSADTQPPTHTTLKGTLSETSITLSWTACTDNVGVAGYNIYRNGTKIGSTSETETTYTDNLIAGENHSYVVKAFDAAGNESTASNPVGAELNAPSIPTDLTIVTKTVKSVSLTWTASKDDVGVTGYEIDRDGVNVGTTSETSYTDSSLAPDITYSYTVRAYDASGNISEPSTAVEVTTEGYVITSNSLAGGSNHSIMLKEGEVWTWGYNGYGQLGDGTTNNRTTAVQVDGLNGIKAVAGGVHHTLALKDDGTIRAWGYGGHGQLGTGTWNSSYSPVLVPGLTAVSAITAGDYHSVALSDGLVWVWGNNGNGQLGDGTGNYQLSPVQVQKLTGVTAIAAGTNYTMALKEDGTVWAWGYGKGWNSYLKPYQVDGLSGITEISARGNHNLALKNDGTVWTWESWDLSAVQVEGISGATAVTAGYNFSMILLNDGTVWTWGSNNRGQLGDGTTTDRATPANVDGLTDIVAIAGGYYHALAKQDNGTLWAWGFNVEGEVGDGTITERTTPVVSADTQAPTQTTLTGTLSESTITLIWTACTDNVGVAGYNIYRNGTKIGSTSETETTYTDNLIAGENHSYVVKAFDAAGNESAASNPVGAEHNAPSIPTDLTLVAKTVKSVSLTWTASTDDVGVTGYEIDRDGTNVGTTTGTSYTDTSLAPSTTYSYTVRAYDASGNISEPSTAIVFTTDEFVLTSNSLAGGSNHSITLKEGTVWTWGYNGYGQLGDGTTTNRTTAVQVPGLNGIKAVAGGVHHTLALKDDGTIRAWGYGGHGQLGDGTWNTSYSPVQVPGLTAVSAITAGDYHSVALSDGLVWVWGNNGNGQLGDGTGNYQLSPVQVQKLTGVTAIAAGANYTMALKEDGTVWAWGYGKNWNSYLKPYQVDGLSGITEISARGNQNLALKNDGTVWTWESWDSSAVQGGGISGATAVAAGYNFNTVLKSDGTVWTWGSNGYGQLGDGTITDKSVPVKVKKITSVKEIAAGNYHGLALKNDETVWDWGFNAEGELGDKTTIHRSIPVIAAGDTIAPSAPTNLKAVSTESSVTLTWTAATDNIEVAGYDIYRDGSLIATTIETVYTDTGLTPGVRYTYSVKAFDGSSNLSNPSGVAFNDNQAPSVPGNLRLSSSTTNSATLAWDSSTDDIGVTGYEIYRNGAKVGSTSDTSYTDQELTPATDYTYTVKAFDAGDNLSEASEPLEISTVQDTLAPTAPSNLIVESDSATFIKFAWTASQDDVGVTGYAVYRDGHKVGQTTMPNFTDNLNVSLGTTYTYTIQAYDASGNESEAATVRFTDDYGNSLAVASLIDVHTEIAGTINYSGDRDYFKLVAPNSGTYVIKSTGQTDTYGELYDNNGQTIIYNDDSADGTNFSITQTLTAGSIYYVAVSNYGGTETGVYGMAITPPDAQAPTTPGELTVADKGYTSVTLTWQASTDDVGVAGYDVYREGNKIATVNATTFTFTDTGLQQDSTYSYTIRAFDTLQNLSEPAGPLTVTTVADTQAPEAPTGLVITGVSGSSVTLAWNPATDNLGVASYEIYRNGVLGGTANIAGFTDTGLTQNTMYAYTVKALDETGNVSENSNQVNAVPVLPHISRVLPLDGITLGGDKLETLYLYFRNNGDLGEMKAELAYSLEGSNWTPVPGPVNGPWVADAENACAYVNWDLKDLTSGNYQVRYTITDRTGNADQEIVAYGVDRTSPAATQNVSALANPDGTVSLAWDQALDADTSYYQIYRSSSNAPGSFSLLAQVNGRFNILHNDRAVVSGQTYYYQVSAVDMFSQEGLPSDTVDVNTVSDTVKPVILGIEPAEGTTLGAPANITVKAEDSLALADITLQYSVTEDVWLDVATLVTAGQAVFSWDTTALQGQVKVRAVACDAAGNVSNSSLIRTFNIDSQGPAQVTGLTGTPSATGVLLHWKDVPDQDFAYFQVERKDSLTGIYQSIGSVNNQLGYNVTGLINNSTYWFQVVAYDQLGNRGTLSEEIQISTTTDTTAPVVTGLGPAPGFFARQIPLTGTAYDDVGVTSLTFQISEDRTLWQDLSTLTPQVSPGSVSVAYNLEVSALPEGIYYVRGKASDAAGNTSNPSSFVQYVIDHTPPAQPQGFTVTASAGDITLHWDQGQENDLAGYRLEKAQTLIGPYTMLADHIMALGYVDRAVEANQPYYYKVMASDQAGNQGLATEPITGQLQADTELPRILSVSPNDGMTLPANSALYALAADNFRLAKVTAVYRAEGEPNEPWLTLASQDLNVYSDVVTFNWNTTGLTEGRYTVRFTAIDTAGQVSEPMEVTYNLNLDPPAKPVITVNPGGWQVDLAWTSGQESDLAGFMVYRSTVSGGPYQLLTQTTGTTYEDKMLEPGRNYYYVIDAIDSYRNINRSAEVVAAPTSVDPYPPSAEAGDDQVVVLGSEVWFDGIKSGDNDRIAKYLWDFGDGTTSSVAQPRHTYTAPGLYQVKLTVYDPSQNSAEDTVSVTVRDPQQVGTLEVRVLDDGGNSISEASIVIQYPDGTMQNSSSDSRGLAIIVANPGVYKVYAYKNEFKPASVTATLVVNQKTTALVTLVRGQLVVGELTVKRMTLDEIIAAGVDVNAPENQWVYNFEVHLAFDNQPFTQSYMVNGLGNFVGGSWQPLIIGAPGGSGGPSYIAYPSAISLPHHPEVRPTIAYMVIPGEARWLKEFFEVGLALENTADPEFVIAGSKATLRLPEGLSLAPTSKAQSLTVDLGDIAGQETRETKWIIRGDEKGYYNLEADFRGRLQPFDDAVQTTFRTQDPFRVWGDDALRMHVDTQDRADQGYPYNVRFGLENISDIPVYNAALELKDAGKQNYIYAPNQELTKTITELSPGETLWADYQLVPSIRGNLLLSESYVLKTGGNATVETDITGHGEPQNLPGTAPVLQQTHNTDGTVTLSWELIDGASGYKIYSIRDDLYISREPELVYTAEAAENTVILSEPDGAKEYILTTLTPEGEIMRHAITGLDWCVKAGDMAVTVNPNKIYVGQETELWITVNRSGHPVVGGTVDVGTFAQDVVLDENGQAWVTITPDSEGIIPVTAYYPTDHQITATTNVTVLGATSAPLIISTPNLSAATTGIAYSQTVEASGGKLPYTWSATGLPNGLSIDSSTGVISGTPTAVGTSTVTVMVADSASHNDEADFNLTVETAAIENSAPTAVAGGPYRLATGEILTLDGSGSTDPDVVRGDRLVKYEWDFDDDGEYEKISSEPITVVSWDEFAPYEHQLSNPVTGLPNYPVTLRVTDTWGTTGTESTTLTIFSREPVAYDDSYEMLQGQTLQSGAGATGVLANDLNWESVLTLKATLVTEPQHGQLTLNIDGSFSYTPNVQFHGMDSFAYKASADPAYEDTATVSIKVNPLPNHAPTAVAGGPYRVATGETLTLDGSESTDPDVASGDRLVKYEWDFDDDGEYEKISSEPITIVSWDEFAPYEHQLSNPVTGLPNYPVTLRVTDAWGLKGTEATTLTLFSREPVAYDDNYEMLQGQTLQSGAQGVLTNDLNWENVLTLKATLVNGPQHGQLTLNIDGSFSYTPNVLFHGTDSFAYKASADPAYEDTATVSIKVNPLPNHAPTAVAGGPYRVATGETLTLDGSGSTDPDVPYGDRLVKYEWDFDGDGAYDWISAQAIIAVSWNELAPYEMQLSNPVTGLPSYPVRLKVTDTFGLTGTESTTLTIFSREPVANDDSYEMQQGQTLQSGAGATGVLANDLNWESVLTLKATLVTEPQHGQLTLNIDGSFSYTPNVQFHGTDSFAYKASADPAYEDTATVSIKVNPLPNHAPTAVAGGPYQINVGEVLALDGSGSSDPDLAFGDRLVKYEWDIDNDGVYEKTSAEPISVVGWSELAAYGLLVANPITGLPNNAIRLKVTDTAGLVNVSDTTLVLNNLLKAEPLIQMGINQNYQDSVGIFIGLDKIIDYQGNVVAQPKIAGYRIEVDFDPAKVTLLDIVDEAQMGHFIKNDAEPGKVVISDEAPNGTSSYNKLFFLPVSLTGSVLDLTSLSVKYLSVWDTTQNPINVGTDDLELHRGKIYNEGPDIEPNISDAVAGLQYLAGSRRAGVELGLVNPVNMASIVGQDPGTKVIKPTVVDIIALLQYLVHMRDPYFETK